MSQCKHCGAAIADRNVSLPDIIGQEHAKRAAEVAVAGKHTIAFIGRGEAEDLAAWCARQGITAYAVQPCPCGWFGNPFRECTCSLSMVSRWQKRRPYRTAMEADIHVEMPPPYDYQVMAYTAGRRGESDEQVLARIARSGVRPSLELDEAGASLLRAAVTMLRLDGDRVRRILEVAATIAALDRGGRERIETHHLAEAIQYWPRGHDENHPRR